MIDFNDIPGHPLPCCVEAPPSYAPKARYALRMLLLPLRLTPRWVKREALAAGGLYYGTSPDGLPENSVTLPLDPRTVDYFEAGAAYDPDAVRWTAWENERWPLLFGEDLVAASFFWLSGWQEFTTVARDRHGRFPHAASLQARLGTTTRPVVEAYRAMLGARLAAGGVPVGRRSWGGAGWVLCPTHDIDYLRKWRRGMIYREVVHYFLRNLRRDSPGARLRRLGSFARDWLRPGDVYRTAFEQMHQHVAAHGGTATYFLKTGAHGPHDVFYPPDDPYLRQRVAALKADGFEIGLHPSYHAHTHRFYLDEERRRLTDLTGEAPVSVRQHYLRYAIPATPRLHEASAFQIDSSLGFAEHEGFRHATCQPFQLFDPLENRPLAVWEMPLSVMESAIFNRRQCSEEEARAATTEMLDTCRRFGGAAVMLWHNVLWDELDHPGWGRHFEETLAAATASGARLAGLHEALAAWLGEAA